MQPINWRLQRPHIGYSHHTSRYVNTTFLGIGYYVTVIAVFFFRQDSQPFIPVHQPCRVAISFTLRFSGIRQDGMPLNVPPFGSSIVKSASPQTVSINILATHTSTNEPCKGGHGLRHY